MFQFIKNLFTKRMEENQPTGVAAEAPAQAPVQEETAAATPEAAAPEATQAPETDTPVAPVEEAAEPEVQPEPEAAASENTVTLVDAVLVTDWSEHKAGDTIKVTPTKKADLIAQGHVAAE